jgi:hypothetical protein
MTVNTHLFLGLIRAQTHDLLHLSEISGKPSFVLKLFYDKLRSFSTFFALNFDKKLAVE